MTPVYVCKCMNNHTGQYWKGQALPAFSMNAFTPIRSVYYPLCISKGLHHTYMCSDDRKMLYNQKDILTMQLTESRCDSGHCVEGERKGWGWGCGVQMSIHSLQIIFSRPHIVKQSQVIMQISFSPTFPQCSSPHYFLLQQRLSPVKSCAAPNVCMRVSSDSAPDKNGKTADAVRGFHSGG